MANPQRPNVFAALEKAKEKPKKKEEVIKDTAYLETYMQNVKERHPTLPENIITTMEEQETKGARKRILKAYLEAK